MLNLNRFLVLALMLMLAACGGGSGSGSKTPPPSSPSSSSSSSSVSSTSESSESSSSESSSSSSSSSSSAPVELTENGGFEASEAGSTSPVNWSLATADGGAVIQVISAADQPANVRSGDRALEVVINTLGANSYSIEATYEGLSNAGIPVNGGSIYSYSVWVKGPAGSVAHFTVGTPSYNERARREVTLSGDWEEVTLEVVTDSADTLLRLPIHLSIAGNEGKTIYLDDMSFKTQESVSYEYSPVTVESLYSLSPGSMPIGVAVAAGNSPISPLTNLPRQTVVKQHFSQLTAENIMKPSYLQPDEGKFFWNDADALVDFAEANGLTVHGHTLMWHAQIPGWMENFVGTPEARMEMMKAHVTAVAGRYANRPSVVSWDVVNEAFEDWGGRYRGDGAGAGTSVWYQHLGKEFIEEAFIAARAAAPNVDLYYNDFNIELSTQKLNSVIAMVEDFRERGIPIDGVGFQMHVSSNVNVNTIRNNLKRVADIHPSIKVKITELDVRFNHVEPPLAADAYTPAMAEQHKTLVRNIVAAYLEVVPAPQRGGITVWGIADADSWIPLHMHKDRPDWPLFFFNDMSPKPALQGFADALMAE